MDSNIKCPPAARMPTLAESVLSIALRSLPIKNGAHRILDKLRPRYWVRSSPIVAVPYKGTTLEMDISDLVGWHFFIMKNFDPEVTEVIQRFAAGDHRDVFWDIGANKGACSYHVASTFPTCRIVAIEPQRDLQAMLARNLSVLALGRYELFPVGVGQTPGQFELMVPFGNRGRATLIGSSVRDSHTTETISVLTAKEIKDQSKFGWPTIVKIDVEGFESSVIKSLSPAFECRGIRCCVFECHEAYAADYSEVRRMVEGYGYQLYAIKKTVFSTSLVPAEALVRGSTDYAIVRDDLN